MRSPWCVKPAGGGNRYEEEPRGVDTRPESEDRLGNRASRATRSNAGVAL